MLEPLKNLIEESNSINQFRCGNSYFPDDVWDFHGYIRTMKTSKYHLKLDFCKWNNLPDMKETIKWCMVESLNLDAWGTVINKLRGFKRLRGFLAVSRPDITSFKDITKEILVEYLSFVLVSKSKTKGTLLSPGTIISDVLSLKFLLMRGAFRGWDVPENTYYVEEVYQQWIYQNERIKKYMDPRNRKRFLPDKEMVHKIIECAIKDPDILTGTSIVVASQLGLRIGEIFALKEDCLSVIEGEAHIAFSTWKTKNEPVIVVRPANSLLVDSIQALKEHTKELRKQSGMPYLFLTKDWNKGTDTIRVPNTSMWGSRQLRPFFKRHNLNDDKGKPLQMTMHHFRHIFATFAIKNGMAIHNVMEALNHKSASMTEVYIDAGDYPKETMRKVLSGEIVVSSTNRNVVECIESSDNPFKGTTTDQAEKLRRATKIEILPHGFCLHHPLRGDPCAQDGVCLGCQYFLVPADRLPVFEARLQRVNEELTKNADTSIYTSKLNFQKQRLGFYVNDLQTKIAVNETLQGLQEVAADAKRS